MIGDEVWCWPDETLLEAFQTGAAEAARRHADHQHRRRATRQPLGRLRRRALAGDAPGAARSSTPRRASGSSNGHCPRTPTPTTSPPSRRPTPRRWISVAALREQHARCTPLASGSSTPACGASGRAMVATRRVEACREDYTVEPGEDGVPRRGHRRSRGSHSGRRRDTGPARRGRRGVPGRGEVLQATDAVRVSPARTTSAKSRFDPWRFQGEALRLEREGRLMIAAAIALRMVPASERLHAAITSTPTPQR